ncbi:MAG: hypothetical protein HZC01_02835 [Candidatus Kerfeldbacteria bacterium]|nr:hypothetical protein [Candidatus Kerfeldbacteria bacterium]
MKRKLFIISIVLMVFSISATTQSRPRWDLPKYNTQDRAYLDTYAPLNMQQSVRKAWVDICGRNQAIYPDLDKVKPGDTILLPLGYDIFVAQAGGRDCMWRAAEYYVNNVVMPYYGRPAPAPETISKPETVRVEAPAPVVPATRTREMPLSFLLLVVAFIVAIVLLYQYSSRRERERERAQKFVPDPPHFENDGDAVVTPVAQSALQRAYGRTIKIVGPIERGYITGDMIMFNKDGSTNTQSFNNEPGFRTLIQFEDGKIREVVSRWSCFNPVYSYDDADFRGFFRPAESSVATEIPVAYDTAINCLKMSIQGNEEPLYADEIPGEVEPDNSDKTETVAAAAPVMTSAPDPEHQLMKLGGCQVSKSRLTLESFEGTPAQLDKVLNTLTRHAQIIGDGKPATPETPASKSDEGTAS